MSQSSFDAPPSASMNLLLPAFEFCAALDTEGQGVVYFCQQKSLDRQVAVKLFPPAFDSDPIYRESFNIAHQAVAALKHPNLIGIFDSGIVEDMPYLVMEFVPGKSLARSTGGQAIEFDQAMILIDGICSGLACAHDNGIFHGNLDPSNILLNKKAEPKVGNFGFKRPVGSGETSAVPVRYTAPEIIGGAPVTGRSDVYSVAAIFYELLTGSPHSPDSQPSSTLSNYGKEIDALLKKATDPDPMYRIADVRAFHEAIKDAAAGGKPKSTQPSAAKAARAHPAEKKAAMVPKVGFDWKLMRNLVIIVGLLFGIHLAWENLKYVRANRNKENKEILAKAADKKKEALAKREQMRKPQLAGDRSNAPQKNLAPMAPRHTETPEESLERLSPGLRSGSRSEMPIGTVHKGSSDYFPVSQKMSWAEAALFAESHGGCLAIPGNDSEAIWLAAEVMKHRATWIGVARGGAESWVTVSGTAWKRGTEPQGEGSFLAVDMDGQLRAEPAGTRHPFAIQWHGDGSNPGTLATQLAATRASLDQPLPLFPPGTVQSGNRYFLHLPRTATWPEASELAESAGGHLMVVSAEEEAADLRNLIVTLDPEERIWLGGRLESDQWHWVTGEPWIKAEWAQDADGGSDGSALVIYPGRGWDSHDSAEAASGFIIEWSADAKSAKQQGIETTDSGKEAAELAARAKEVILAADRKRSQALTANIKKFVWDLDDFVSGQNKSGQVRWSPEVARIKTCMEDNRILHGELASQKISFSVEMLKITEYAARKQGEIDASFAESAKTIRDSYVAKMTVIRDSALKSGQIKVVKSANEAIASAEDLATWVGSFGLDLPQ